MKGLISTINIHCLCPQLMFSSEGVPYMTADGKRKTSIAEVTLYGGGTGQRSINNQDIHYFKNLQEREQVGLSVFSICKIRLYVRDAQNI